MAKNTYLLLFLIQFLSLQAVSQELNCTVKINTQRLQITEARVFQTLENHVYEFLNNRKWTDDVFKNEERIECSIFINVTEELSSDKFRAQVNVQSSRPTFHSSYNTVLFNYADKDWVFNYTEFQPLDFNENAFITNLTSMLAFYAYVIIGMDYDSYSLKGGTPYFVKAQSIINNVPSNLGSENAPGWKPFEGNRNRYWLIENLLNSRFDPLRSAYYQYHLQGMDVMYENIKSGRQVILSTLKNLEQLATEFPNSMLLKVFFDAKSEEIINIFSQASPSEKSTAVQLLYKTDPVNSSKYSKIMK